MTDSMEELEKLDVPRGLIAAANRYASEQVPIPVNLSEFTLEGARRKYAKCFDTFVAGAKWCLKELTIKDVKCPSGCTHDREIDCNRRGLL